MSVTPIAPNPCVAEPAGEVLALVERLAEGMARYWRRGERRMAEELLNLHPHLWQVPDAVLELVAEELNLRRECGDEVSPEELLGRFPQWQDQMRALLECHRALAGDLAALRCPLVGETLGEFRLLAELGRGAHGRVFVAAQPALANRPVVLKLGANSGREHLSLARLQHTHIVPLYSVHEFPSRRLRGLCLPYFGGTTLEGLLTGMRAISCEQRTGRDLLQALRQTQNEAVPVTVAGPACRFLLHASYVQAICWLGASLADALQYAAEHGLVHLDLKPSNVLIAADGQPMLLDFHLAQAPKPAGAPAPPWLGGTPGYMAPEHLAAVEAVSQRRALATAVDGRADLYSLGAVLQEALTGQRHDPAQGRLRYQRHVTPGLADLLARCLAPDPRDRYPTAADLAADLRRHLTDWPLQGVRNRSPAERWRKWRRRRPLTLPMLGLTSAVLVALLLLASFASRHVDKARAALLTGEDLLRAQRFGEARETLQHAADLAEDIPGCGNLLGQLQERMRQAIQGQAAAELHAFCERVRPLYETDLVPPSQARAVEARCHDLWQQRLLILERLGGQTDARFEQQVRADLLDVAILWRSLHGRLAAGTAARAASQETLAVFDEAEKLLGPSCIIEQERRTHLLALGAASEAVGTVTLAPRTAWEHYTIGRGYLRRGDLPQAAREMDRALELQPQALWPNFYKGCCACRMGQFDDAVAAFSVCVVLAPESAWCYCNRGLAYNELGRSEKALRDYERALALDPVLTAALLGRGTLHYREHRLAEARSDLRRALELGMDTPIVHCNLALVYLAMKDRSAALDCLRQALRRNPDHPRARELLTQLNPEP